jgi:hypothetical protein
LIARRYKESHSSLKTLGIAIFVNSFALVSIPTLSELLCSASPGSLGLRLATGLVLDVLARFCDSRVELLEGVLDVGASWYSMRTLQPRTRFERLWRIESVNYRDILFIGDCSADAF